MQDAWRAYLELAMGLTEASRRKAEQVARDLLGKGGATAGQLQSAAEELLAASRANRENLTKLVRYELDRALGRVGLASSDEVSDLTERVQKLERELRETTERAAAAEAAAGAVPARPVAAAGAKAPAKTTAKKATAKKTTAKKVPAEPAAAAKTTKKTVAKKPARKGGPTQVPVKKAQR
jgi:polyhydroxyalkanoate synthesis regulator phasin